MNQNKIFPNECDDNFYRHVGYTQDNKCIQEYFNNKTVKTIQRKVTELTLGVDPQNRPFKVTDRVICSLMSQIYESFRPSTGDIHSRYIVPGYGQQNYVNDMINQVIEIIVSDIKINVETDENNKKLTAWTTVLGDFNKHNLRGHSIIKVQNKRPASFQFNMNY